MGADLRFFSEGLALTTWLITLVVGWVLFRRTAPSGKWKRDFSWFMGLWGVGVAYLFVSRLFGVDAYVSRLEEVHIVNIEEINISAYSILRATYTLVLMWMGVRLVRGILQEWIARTRSQVEADSLYSLITNLAVLVVAMVFLLQLGITWKVLLPFAGALGIGLGFGLQTTFNNYISGLILILSRNLKVGDVIEFEGNAGKAIRNPTNIVYGRVSSINVLTTHIHTPDGLEIAVPNSYFVSNKVINYTLSDELVRLHVPFGVAYSSDPLLVKKVLLELAEESKEVLKNPKPEVWFYEMGDSALIFHLLVWINIRAIWRTNDIISSLYFRGWEKLKGAGIEVPFPQREIWFRSELPVRIVPEGKLTTFTQSRGQPS